jgi:hypothetical protein
VTTKAPDTPFPVYARQSQKIRATAESNGSEPPCRHTNPMRGHKNPGTEKATGLRNDSSQVLTTTVITTLDKKLSREIKKNDRLHQNRE